MITDIEAIEADREALAERAAIMEYDGGLSKKEAAREAISITRFRCWRLWLDDGSCCTAIEPEGATLAEYQPHSAIAYRVVRYEPNILSAIRKS